MEIARFSPSLLPSRSNGDFREALRVKELCRRAVDMDADVAQRLRFFANTYREEALEQDSLTMDCTRLQVPKLLQAVPLLEELPVLVALPVRLRMVLLPVVLPLVLPVVLPVVLPQVVPRYC